MPPLPWERPNWRVNLWLIGICFSFFFLELQNPETHAAAVGFHPQAALEGLALWRFITYPFVFGSPFSFFVVLLVVWMTGTPLEELWGSPSYLAFLLVSVLGASGMGAIVGVPVVGMSGLIFNLLVVYAIHFPDAVWLVMFVIPVRVRWLAMLAAVLLLLRSLGAGTSGLAMMVGTASGLIFWAIRLRSAKAVRRVSRKVKTAAEALVPRRDHRDEALAMYEEVKAMRQDASTAPGAEEQARLEEIRSRLVADVNVCTPEHFDPESEHCPVCNGFVECTLRSFGLSDLPARKPGGRTATGAADALAARHAREREEARKVRIRASDRPAIENS